MKLRRRMPTLISWSLNQRKIEVVSLWLSKNIRKSNWRGISKCSSNWWNGSWSDKNGGNSKRGWLKWKMEIKDTQIGLNYAGFAKLFVKYTSVSKEQSSIIWTQNCVSAPLCKSNVTWNGCTAAKEASKRLFSPNFATQWTQIILSSMRFFFRGLIWT